ncbi:hypothetical protein Taro_003357, partial [Colocasia esculenta]|nr:hypothetical protein [Colocasia esculenta]
NRPGAFASAPNALTRQPARGSSMARHDPSRDYSSVDRRFVAVDRHTCPEAYLTSLCLAVDRDL